MLTEVTPAWKITFKTKPQSKNDFLYVASVETSLVIHMGFHTDGHKIIRSRYWWNFPISTQPCFFPKHPFKKTTGFTALRMFVHPFFFLHPFLSTVKAMKPLRGRRSLAQQGWRWRWSMVSYPLLSEIASGWDSNPANLSKLQRLLWHSNYTDWFIGILRMAYYNIYIFG